MAAVGGRNFVSGRFYNHIWTSEPACTILIVDCSASEHLVPSDVDASAFPPTNYCAPTCEYDHQPERLRLCHEAMGHEAVVNPIVNGLLVQRLFDEVPFHRRKCSNPMETTEF